MVPECNIKLKRWQMTANHRCLGRNRCSYLENLIQSFIKSCSWRTNYWLTA